MALARRGDVQVREIPGSGAVAAINSETVSRRLDGNSGGSATENNSGDGRVRARSAVGTGVALGDENTVVQDVRDSVSLVCDISDGSASGVRLNLDPQTVLPSSDGVAGNFDV